MGLVLLLGLQDPSENNLPSEEGVPGSPGAGPYGSETATSWTSPAVGVCRGEPGSRPGGEPRRRVREVCPPGHGRLGPTPALTPGPSPSLPPTLSLSLFLLSSQPLFDFLHDVSGFGPRGPVRVSTVVFSSPGWSLTHLPTRPRPGPPPDRPLPRRSDPDGWGVMTCLRVVYSDPSSPGVVGESGVSVTAPVLPPFRRVLVVRDRRGPKLRGRFRTPPRGVTRDGETTGGDGIRRPESKKKGTPVITWMVLPEITL